MCRGKILLSAIGSVAASLCAGATVQAATLSGYWNFDSPANVGDDTSTNNNDLTARNGATQTASGKFGGGLLLNAASSQYLDAASNTMPGIPTANNPYSISVWFKSSNQHTGGFVGWGGYGTGNAVNALRTFGDANGFRHYWWSNDLDRSAPIANIYDGSFHNIIATFDGTSRTLYFDGVSIGGDSPGGAHNVPANAPNFRIGSTNSSEFFNGTLDDVAIYTGALTQTEINALQLGPAVPEPAMLGSAGLTSTLALLRRRRRT